MKFDIIEISAAELEALSTIQMQLLRTAQKNKNELRYKTEKDFEMFKKFAYSNGMKNSSLIEQKRAELEAEFEYKTAILVEQLMYAIELNEPFPDRDEEDEKAGYIVDYTLSYTDRYIIVRDYYLSINDPAERMALYASDEVAKRYLGNYYSTLYNVLYTYST